MGVVKQDELESTVWIVLFRFFSHKRRRSAPLFGISYHVDQPTTDPTEV